MIYGVTHEKETHAPIQRLAVCGKISIGEVICKAHKKPDCGSCPRDDRKAWVPRKSSSFLFRRKDDTTHEWVKDQEMTEKYGKDCHSVWIVLLDDDLDSVFRTEMAWWSATECICHGDGVLATRRTQEHPEGQAWTPCGEGCPDLGPGRPCKPNGILHFMLADVPKLGGVWKFDTTGYRSIRQIHSSLIQLQNIFGRLAGIRCQLVVRPEKSKYIGQDKKKHTSTIYAVSIEIPARDVRSLVAEATGPATAFEGSRRALGAGRVEYVEPTEPERAKELQPEFYPAQDIQPADAKEPKRKSKKGKTAEPESNNQTTPEPRADKPLEVKGVVELIEKGRAASGSEYRKVRVSGLNRWLWTYDNRKLSLMTDLKTGDVISERLVTAFDMIDGAKGMEFACSYKSKPGSQGGEWLYIHRIIQCGKAHWDEDGLPVRQLDAMPAPKVGQYAPVKAQFPDPAPPTPGPLFDREPGE